jgi:hypothetical protein
VTDDEFLSHPELFASCAARFALVQTTRGSGDISTCLIFDLRTNCAVLIEDDEVASQTMRALHDAGVPIVQTVPEGCSSI